MTRYVILRHGSNGANQHLTQTMALGIVEAGSRRAAVDVASEHWTCYANQWFDPIAWSRASPWQRDAAYEADEAVEYEVQP
jgi:hypothetical protein